MLELEDPIILLCSVCEIVNHMLSLYDIQTRGTNHLPNFFLDWQRVKLSMGLLFFPLFCSAILDIGLSVKLDLCIPGVMFFCTELKSAVLYASFDL